MRWIFRIIGAVFVLLIILVGIIFMMPKDRFVTYFEEQFETQTGRAIDIEGPISTTIFPTLGVKTGAIKIANADWSKSGPMLEAHSLAIGVDFRSLMQNSLDIKSIEFVAPSIRLETSKKGVANWDIAPVSAGSSGASDPALSIKNASISNGTITYRDGVSGAKYDVQHLDATLKMPSLNGAADLDLSAEIGGVRVASQTQIMDVSTFLTGALSPIKGTAKIAGNSISLNGKLGYAPVQSQGQISAQITDLKSLMKMVGGGAPSVPYGFGAKKIALDGAFSLTPKNSLHLRKSTIVLDNNTLAANLDLYLEKRPRVVMQVTAGALDFSGLMEGGSGSGTGWSTSKIDYSALSSVNASVGVSAQSLNLGDIKLGATKAKLVLDRSRLSATLLEAAGFGGQITGELVANGRKGLSVSSNLTAKSVDVQALLKATAGVEKLRGTGNMRFKMLSSGDTMQMIMSRMNGSGSIAMNKGAIEGVDMISMLKKLDKSFQSGSEETDFDALTASFTIKNGVLFNEDLLFKGAGISSTGKGQVGIGAQTINYRLLPKALVRAGGTEGFEVPVLVTGPWANVSFRPDLEWLAKQKFDAEAKALEAQAKAKAKEAEKKAKAKIAKKLGLDQEASEGDAKDALKKKLEEEAKKGLLKLFE